MESTTDPANGKPAFDLTTAQWLAEPGHGEGPQIAHLKDGYVALRNGAEPDGPVLIYTPEEWDVFRRGVINGGFA